MGTNEMLQRAITYEQAVLRNYRQYAAEAEGTEIGQLFSQLVQDKAVQIEKLKSMLKRYCKTCGSHRQRPKLWEKPGTGLKVDEETGEYDKPGETFETP